MRNGNNVMEYVKPVEKMKNYFNKHMFTTCIPEMLLIPDVSLQCKQDCFV